MPGSAGSQCRPIFGPDMHHPNWCRAGLTYFPDAALGAGLHAKGACTSRVLLPLELVETRWLRKMLVQGAGRFAGIKSGNWPTWVKQKQGLPINGKPCLET